MAASWSIVKAFLRAATEKPDYSLETDLQAVYAKLRAIQNGHFESATDEDNLIQIGSTIGGTSFQFAAPNRLDRAQIIEAAESALGIVESVSTVAQIRALINKRVKSTRTDFSQSVVT